MNRNSVLIPEIYASNPQDGKVLEYYKGYFEAVYIMLHPFYRGISMDLGSINNDDWPTDQELREGCVSVSWQEVIKLTKFQNFSQIDIGLRTLFGALNKDVANENYALELERLFIDNGILYPDATGIISPFLSDAILKCLNKLNYTKLWQVDEFSYQPAILYNLDELLISQQTHHCNYTEDHKVLFATHWDSQCTFLCSSKEIIEKILEIYPFEGFFCTPNTEVYWGLHDI